MTINKANRSELEIMILNADLEDTLFDGLDAITKMDTEEIREKLINWILENDETDC